MENFLIGIIESYGAIGIAFLIFIENVFPPIPSELILVFGGFMTTKSSMSIVSVIIAATIGSVAGAAVLYLLGKILKRDRLKAILAGRTGRILHFKPEDVDKADAWFDKYGYKTVFLCRCVPVIRSIISIPAGIAEMKLAPFFILTFLGSAMWNTVLTLIGRFAGDAWEKSLEYINIYSDIIIAIIAVAIVVFIAYKLVKKFKK